MWKIQNCGVCFPIGVEFRRNFEFSTPDPIASGIFHTHRTFDFPTFDFPTFDFPTFDFPTFDFPTFDFPNFDFPTFDFPTFDFPTFDFPTFDFPTFDFPTFDFPTFDFIPPCPVAIAVAFRRRAGFVRRDV